MITEPNNYEFQHPDPNSRLNKFRSIAYDPELQQLKQILIGINRWEDDNIQKLFKRAKLGRPPTRLATIREILYIYEKYKNERMESGNVFMPHAMHGQISNNGQGVHICDQVGNNIPMNANNDDFQLNTLVAGRPKAGKSSGVFCWLSQLLFLPLLIFDIKNIWRHRARALNAKVIQPPFHIDLEPPRGIHWYDWIFSIADGISSICGLQFGVAPLLEAAKIALQQRQRYIDHTRTNTSLSLMDIFKALDFVNIAGFKRDYILSCKAALQLIIGPNDLFAARKGIPLEEILNGRYTIECCYLSAMQCKFLAFYFLNYLLQASYQRLEKVHISRLVFIDDSGSFINRPDNVFGQAPKTSFWGDMLSKLRSSGTGLIFADQLISSIFDDVKRLCGNWIIVGGLNIENYEEVMAAMKLTKEQADFIGKMKTRECIAYFPLLYPRPIYGVVPLVSSIAEGHFNE
ncbi:MAG: hypothetical protein A2Y10_14795 [Planctomycetes bacterium GWF2_41_51]|nr:MAG: hypothetical protein A2Y10_14795 [Planctomycetes bacterium GWF2_41_51]HBG28989.1 hypothetical protein [Phycisphaerales bacterium]